jgi:hypothetical protein
MINSRFKEILHSPRSNFKSTKIRFMLYDGKDITLERGRGGNLIVGSNLYNTFILPIFLLASIVVALFYFN